MLTRPAASASVSFIVLWYIVLSYLMTITFIEYYSEELMYQLVLVLLLDHHHRHVIQCLEMAGVVSFGLHA